MTRPAIPALRLLPLALGCLLAAPIQAAPIQVAVAVATGWRYDSNPFRFTDSAEARAAFGSSRMGDTVLSAELAGKLVVPVLSERTRLEVKARVGHDRYSRFSLLDNDPTAVDASFYWHYGDSWAGRLGASMSDQLYRYSDGGFTVRDREHRRAGVMDFEYRPSERLSGLLTLETARQTYDDAAHLRYNVEETAWDIGARYRSRPGSSLALRWRQADGRYMDRTPVSNYLENEWYLAGEWVFSPKTKLNARLGYLTRDYSLAATEDVSLVSLDSQLAWLYSSKTRMDLFLYRRAYPSAETDSDSTIIDGLKGSLTWHATPKVDVLLNLTGMHVDFRNSQNRVDYKLVADSRVEYEYAPPLKFYFMLGREDVSSNVPQGESSQYLAGLGVQYLWENIRKTRE